MIKDKVGTIKEIGTTRTVKLELSSFDENELRELIFLCKRLALYKHNDMSVATDLAELVEFLFSTGGVNLGVSS